MVKAGLHLSPLPPSKDTNDLRYSSAMEERGLLSRRMLDQTLLCKSCVMSPFRSACCLYSQAPLPPRGVRLAAATLAPWQQGLVGNYIFSTLPHIGWERYYQSPCSRSIPIPFLPRPAEQRGSVLNPHAMVRKE